MATPAQITAHAKAWADVANQIKSAYTLAKELSLYNSVNDPGWGDLANQVAAAVDADGLVEGTEYLPADVSSAIGSANQLITFMDGGAATTGSAWINNLEKIAKPIV